MSITPLTFTGTSQYSADFQSILTRAVSIASIPLQQLQTQDQTDLSKESQLATVGTSVSSLVSSVAAFGSLAANQALSASSSNSSAVSFLYAGATAPASYTVNSVTSLATAAAETSLTGYADSGATPVSSTGTLNLVVGSQNYTITLTPETNNLVGLQNAINSLGVGVSASILTTGSETGNYLSVSATATGATTLQLFDDPTGANTNLISDTNQGTDAQFQLNGINVTRSSNTVNDLISGATLTLTGTTTTPVTLNLSSDSTQIASALQTFASAYNSVVDQINSQSGSGAGVLIGDPIIWQLQSSLRELTSYQGSGSISSLSDLGISLGSDGKMTVDSSVVSGLTTSQISSAFQYFGSTTTGFGGLSQTLSQVSDPITGAVATETATLAQDDANLQTQIADTITNINNMQNTLFLQLSQADTLISGLNSQQSALTASIQSLNYVLYGKPVGS